MIPRLGLAGWCLFVISIISCQGNQEGKLTTETKNTQSVSQLNPDSLREEYQKRLAELPSRFPSKQVFERGKLYPVDEGILDTSFFLFREAFLDAITRRDVLYLLDVCDENIKSGFGGEDSLPQFVEAWQLDKDASGSQVWEILLKILRNGGVFENGQRNFYAPFTFATFPDEYDAFEYGVITGEGVRVRQNPDTRSAVVTKLTYDVVQKLPNAEPVFQTIDGEDHPWVKVKTLDGKEGFVYGKYFTSPIDFRAGFERRPGNNWKMIFLVAGD